MRARFWVALALALAGCARGALATDRVVLHKKVRRSVLLRAKRAAVEQTRQQHHAHRTLPHPPRRSMQKKKKRKPRGLELLQEIAAETPAVSGEETAQAAKQLDVVNEAQVEADKALHYNEEERDMLQTQMLSTGQSMYVIKRMALTVQRMKEQVEALEQHEKLCRKRVADLRAGQYQTAEDARLANQVKVIC
mmetsp:Transcript_34161/g.90226  ORF Transcript_34161/g.90226 Transcript_34161/m.90226 type:complete len:193 (+) Transcript_34161:124-702(+)